MHCSHFSRDTATVFVVDPDPATGGMISEVLHSSGLAYEDYRSARDFLAAFHPLRPGCLVLEQRIPDMSGLQLQRRLVAQRCSLPLVFVTANSDISTAVELMRGGAVHVLEEPARPLELYNAIHEALELDRDRRRAKEQRAQLTNLTATLTRKERQVLELIAQGRSCKAMASDLDLSVRAIELRRNKLMQKLNLHSPSDLLRFAVFAENEVGDSLNGRSSLQTAIA
jgi:two-component system, LuxR family, response regulator FixJ